MHKNTEAVSEAEKNWYIVAGFCKKAKKKQKEKKNKKG
jgi:hypothetical protein